MHRSSHRLAIIAAAGLCLFALSLLLPQLAKQGYAAPVLQGTLPELQVAKDDGRTSVQPGEIITYTLTYTNNTADVDFPLVSLVETVPGNTEFVKGSSSTGWDCADGSSSGTVCALSLDTVSAGTGGSKTFVVQVLDPLAIAASNIANTTRIESDGDELDRITILTPLDLDFALTFEKDDLLADDADSNGIASPGDTIRYTILISSSVEANAPIADLVLNDNPSPATTLVTGSVTTTLGTIVSGNGVNDTIVQLELGDFSIGEVVTVTFDTLVKSPIPANLTRVVNQAFLVGDNLPLLASNDPRTTAAGDATVTTLLARAEMAASKDDELLVDADSSGGPTPGDTLRYRIRLSNDGNQSLANVNFQDNLDPNTQLVPGSVTASQGLISTSSSSVSVDVGTIPGDGGLVDIVFDATINASVPNGVTEISNQGSVTSAVLPEVLTDDPDFAGTADPTRTAITADAQVYLTLRDLLYADVDGDQVVSEGDTLLYIARLFNNGNQAAANLTYEHFFSPQLALQSGTVTVDRALVTKGNGPSDSSVEATLDELAGGDSILITYLVKVVDTHGLTKLTTQARATYTNGTERQLVSDDPDTPTPFDPTVTIIGSGQPDNPRISLPWVIVEGPID